jgi:hypothetical protein
VSIKGSAYARFRRALETADSASVATAAAYELPQLNLADALRLCLAYARADRSRCDRAIVRWHARLCLDAKGLDPLTAPSPSLRRPDSPAPTATSLPSCSPPSPLSTNCPTSLWSSMDGLTTRPSAKRHLQAGPATELVEGQAAFSGGESRAPGRRGSRVARAVRQSGQTTPVTSPF